MSQCVNIQKPPLPFHTSLLSPDLNVSKSLMKNFSLSLLYSSELFLVCSRMNTFNCSRLWSGWFQWAPVALLRTRLEIYPLWSARRSLNFCPEVPMYRFLHDSFWHSSKYIILNVLQFTFLFIFHVFFESIFTSFVSWIKGHAVQDFAHFFMPFTILSG